MKKSINKREGKCKGQHFFQIEHTFARFDGNEETMSAFVICRKCGKVRRVKVNNLINHHQ